MKQNVSTPIYASIFLVSASTLAWEISLTRIFAITQFYHFAFLVVNVALLGFGASGTVLALRPQWTTDSTAVVVAHRHQRSAVYRRLEYCSLAFTASLLGSYCIINFLPFDSYAVAWDSSQIWLLILYYLTLATPFFFTGLAVGIALSMTGTQNNRTYAANLLGSAGGALLVPLILPILGIPDILFLIAALGLLAAAITRWQTHSRSLPNWRSIGAGLAYLSGWFALLLLVVLSPAIADLNLSVYKGLPQALNYPQAAVIAREDGVIARTELIESGGVRSLPGLSFQYSGPLPPQYGLFSDSDDLSPVIDSREDIDLTALDYMPEALAYELRSEGATLILNPRGGLAIWQAINPDDTRRQVYAVEPDPDIIAVVNDLLDERSPYRQPQVLAIPETTRSFLQRTPQNFDIIHLPLNQPFRPVTSGAYSLGETYDLTLQAMQEYIKHLTPDGILVLTRWLQTPPSESARALALVIESLKRQGIEATSEYVVAIRGVQTATFFVKRTPWTAAELGRVRQFALDRRFDLALAPDLRMEETNQFNVTPDPYYEQVYAELVAGEDVQGIYNRQPFDITPPSDDHPFFFHFFKWSQTSTVLRTLGQTWQPFGGSGILVLVALLVLSALASVILIILPLLLGRVRSRSPQPKLEDEAESPSQWHILLYFGALGLGFMLVEIPLIQRFILFIGHPTLALAVVLAGILFWSGLGSLISPRFSWHRSLFALVATLLLYVMALTIGFEILLGGSSTVRLIATFMLLAPAGLLIGMPFPGGLRWLAGAPGLIPWAWAINGCASVIGSVLAALLALQWGFSVVLWLGIGCYLLAFAITWLNRSPTRNRHPAPRPPAAQTAPRPG